jgi:hypothetical protein
VQEAGDLADHRADSRGPSGSGHHARF